MAAIAANGYELNVLYNAIGGVALCPIDAVVTATYFGSDPLTGEADTATEVHGAFPGVVVELFAVRPSFAAVQAAAAGHTAWAVVEVEEGGYAVIVREEGGE